MDGVERVLYVRLWHSPDSPLTNHCMSEAIGWRRTSFLATTSLGDASQQSTDRREATLNCVVYAPPMYVHSLHLAARSKYWTSRPLNSQQGA